MIKSAHEIRKSFFDFFIDKKHHIVPSAPLGIKDDPSLMFINAGMNPFKEIFLGNKPITHPRIANVQKCLRVTGKHNDLEQVGVDTYHHTFFEMLGNWSFGDYFKKEIIAWSWQYITQVLGLDSKDLYVTVFNGSNQESIPQSKIAYQAWKEHIGEEKIIFFGKKDNFWEMGATGPCGPCSEIHIDCRSKKEKNEVDGRELINLGHPQVIELWNLVFIQYDKKANGKLTKLPNFYIDTGLGLERLSRVLHGVNSNYDTDIFIPLLESLAGFCHKQYGKNQKTDIAFRVIVDHIRAATFCIGDGIIPSNIKQGYVIRRLLRRAVRYGYSFLGFQEPFLHKLLPVLVSQFKDIYPEILHQQNIIEKMIFSEEKNFLKTIANGMERFEKHISQHKGVSGEVAFELLDTYGFPIDLLKLIAQERSIAVDEKGFFQELAKQKHRSKTATEIAVHPWDVQPSDIQFAEFIGYDCQKSQARLLSKRKVDGKKKSYFQLIFDKTPFYAQSGGQVGDIGTISNAKGEVYTIFNTVKENGQILHCSYHQNIQGKDFTLAVDSKTRAGVTCHHSATHLLLASLKKILGSHVIQKGSYVGFDKLRFDFAHFNKLSDQEIDAIETLVNDKIADKIKLVEERDVPYKEAISTGANALFGEKYGDFVRIVSFDKKFSHELCGGTHVSNTSKILYFKIIAQSAVASGIRRIEAIAGLQGLDFLKAHYKNYQAIQHLLKSKQEPIVGLKKLLSQQSILKQKTDSLEQFWVGKQYEMAVEKKQKIGLASFYALNEDMASSEMLKNLCYKLLSQQNNLVFLGSSVKEQKILIFLMISNNLVNDHGCSAKQWLESSAYHIDGKGGGEKFVAMGSGKNILGLNPLTDHIKSMVKNII